MNYCDWARAAPPNARPVKAARSEASGDGTGRKTLTRLAPVGTLP
jgi:hypothetical protein